LSPDVAPILWPCENSGPYVRSTFRHLYIEYWLLKGFGWILRPNPLCSSIWHQIGGTEWVEKYNDSKHGPRILCNLVGDLQKESKRIFSFIVQVFCLIFVFFPIVVTQRLLSFYLYFSAFFDTSLIAWLWYVKNSDTVTAVCQHAVSKSAVFHHNATRRSGPTRKRPYLTYTQWYFCILRQTVSVPYSFIKSWPWLIQFCNTSELMADISFSPRHCCVLVSALIRQIWSCLHFFLTRWHFGHAVPWAQRVGAGHVYCLMIHQKSTIIIRGVPSEIQT